MFRERQCLWLTTSLDYLNKNHRRAAFLEILAKYCKNFAMRTLEDLKVRWNSSKTNYQKDHFKVAASERNGTFTDDVSCSELIRK